MPIVCPHHDCKIELAPQDLRRLLTKEELEKYHKYSLNQAVNASKEYSWCPTPNCANVFVYDPEVFKDEPFNCQLCKQRYCLACRAPYHSEMTCEQFRIGRDPDLNDLAFLEFIRGAKYKMCPFCNFWVEKTDGCDHMSCRCGKEFCYRCGGVYRNCDCYHQGYWMDQEYNDEQYYQNINQLIGQYIPEININANYISEADLNYLKTLPRNILLRRFGNDNLTLHRLGIITLGTKALNRLRKQEA